MIQETTTDVLFSARTSTVRQFFFVQVIQFSGRVQNNGKGLHHKREGGDLKNKHGHRFSLVKISTEYAWLQTSECTRRSHACFPADTHLKRGRLCARAVTAAASDKGGGGVSFTSTHVWAVIYCCSHRECRWGFLWGGGDGVEGPKHVCFSECR